MENDKKLHLLIAMIAAFVLNILLFMATGSRASSAFTMIAGTLAILAWEIIPKWLKEKTNINLPSWLDRTYSVADMWYGLIGLAIGLISSELLIILF